MLFQKCFIKTINMNNMLRNYFKNVKSYKS